MPKLLYASASPYSAKVRMAAAYAGSAARGGDRRHQRQRRPSSSQANPLGKIPVLLTDDGDAVFDSRAITQYLNRVSGGALFPRNAAKRSEAERLEALADGICDCLLAHVYERRSRPEEKSHQPWLDKQWGKAMRALDHLTAAMPKLPRKPTAGHIALRATLGYLDLRFPGQWERGRTKLKRWAARFDERFPELARLSAVVAARNESRALGPAFATGIIRVLKSELHADAEGDAVFVRIDRLRAAAGVEVGRAEIGVAILDAPEHLFGQLDVDAGAGRPAEHGVAVVDRPDR